MFIYFVASSSGKTSGFDPLMGGSTPPATAKGEFMDIYLDNAATTQMSPAVWDVLAVQYDDYGNPSSIHSKGRKAKTLLEDARAKIAECINCKPSEVFFTSGGTESDNTALKGVMFRAKKKKLITSVIEHSAILETCKFLEKCGCKVEYIPVDHYGVIDLEKLENAIDSETALVSVMMANNEIGTIEPIEKIGKITRDKKVLLHTDAVQAAGALPIDVQALGCDLLSISGHKFHSQKGVGALYIRDGVDIEPLIHGGGQEKGFRSGTENVSGYYGMAIALENAIATMEQRNAHLEMMKKQFLDGLDANKIIYKINGAKNRLPNNINLSFPAYKGNLVVALDYYGIQCSSGSACSHNRNESSYVLKAIGCTKKQQETSLRFSFGENTEAAEIDYLVGILSREMGK